MSQPAGNQLDTDQAPCSIRSDTLADSVVILAVMSVLQRLVGFARSFLFCRWLDPDQLGVWEMALGFASLASPVIVLGLPGSFVRYTEYFRQRKQLRVYIRYTLLASTVFAAVGLVVLACAAPTFSRLAFGTSAQADLVRLLAIVLASLTAFNVLDELLLSLRLARYQAVVQFLQSVMFALLSITLLACWRTDATSVLLAYGVTMAIAFGVGVCFLRRTWLLMPTSTRPLSQRSLWTKLAPFAFWIWVSNWLANLFQTADRYMIIHVGGYEASEALTLVGQYHSAAVIPLVLVGFAGVLGGIITPHISHDWEAGRRQAVNRRMNLAIKLLAATMATAAVFVLFVAPLLFEIGFKGKYADGLGVLPLTLMYCGWLGLAYLAASYLWCAERAYLSSVALALGLATNIVLNLILLPQFGLAGAVMATSIANFTTLVTIYGFSRWLGLKVDLGVWLFTLTPTTLCLGPWAALCTLLIVLTAAAFSRKVLNRYDRVALFQLWQEYYGRVSNLLRPGDALSEPHVR